MYDAIYLSPHLDDIPLSCGGHIAQQVAAGARVLVVVAMAGDAPSSGLSDFATYLHESWAAGDNPFAQRRAEEEAACRILGAEWQHWEIPDCIYRKDAESGEAFYTAVDDIFGAVASAETPLFQSLAERFKGLPSAETVYSPLARGNHVDHQLVRAAAEAAFGVELTYYEDYPYVQREGFEGMGDGWVSETINLAEPAIETRIQAIAAHESQLDMLFGGKNTMIERVREYVAHVDGERIWRK